MICACEKYAASPWKRDIILVIEPLITERHGKLWCGQFERQPFPGDGTGWVTGSTPMVDFSRLD